ncbi:MAG: bifunctional 4-hydroxy-3-methylbut-2-enyl diphosphate reductase/30S ribosomal protein S1 [Anaerovoracaceae bacterium]
MKIKVAEHSGFCFGVREAIRKTEALIEKRTDKDERIYTCGPLIHNRAVTEDLSSRGVKIVGQLSLIPPASTIVIRSHGEPKSFHDEAARLNLSVVDATCPFVSKIHRLVAEAKEKGRNVVIVGDTNHPEVKGIVGWAGENCVVINSIEEAEKIAFDHITLVAQTTITGTLWNGIVDYLREEKTDLIPIRTICNATDERQKSCEELARESDLMIVIGDRNSANSRKLFEIAQKHCKKTFFVENKNDLPLKQIEICGRIGVAAGASTPERIIKEVISTMSEAITETKELQVAEVGDNPAAEETVVEAPVEAEAAVEETPLAEETPEAGEAQVVEETPVADEAPAAEVAEEQDEDFNPMDDFMDEIDKQMILPSRGEIIDGEIVHVTNREIVVNLGCKKDGIIPKDELVLDDGQELTDVFKAGDSIQAKVIKTDDGEGNILLSKRKLEINEHWDEINEALDNKTVVNAKVVKEVKGGVIAVYKEVSGFIPMSQLSDRYVEKADEFVGKILPVKVSRVDQRRNKAVFSHKAYLAEEKQKRVKEIWDALNVGDVVEGTVMRFTDYGAFVDIGGLDGLLHISEISWGKLRHPQEALKIGERIDVKILSMNTEKGKISLGLKQTQPEPWSVIDEKYKPEQVITGNVVQIKEYGAFVELEPGLDGLVHISEIAHKRVTNIADEISVGQTVEAKILDIDKERRRISLSIKETIEPSLMDDEDGPSLKEKMENMADKAEDFIEDVKEKAEDIADDLKEKAEDLLDKAEDVAEAVSDKVEEIVEDVKEKIED